MSENQNQNDTNNLSQTPIQNQGNLISNVDQNLHPITDEIQQEEFADIPSELKDIPKKPNPYDKDSVMAGRKVLNFDDSIAAIQASPHMMAPIDKLVLGTKASAYEIQAGLNMGVDKLTDLGSTLDEYRLDPDKSKSLKNYFKKWWNTSVYAYGRNATLDILNDYADTKVKLNAMEQADPEAWLSNMIVNNMDLPFWFATGAIGGLTRVALSKAGEFALDQMLKDVSGEEANKWIAFHTKKALQSKWTGYLINGLTGATALAGGSVFDDKTTNFINKNVKEVSGIDLGQITPSQEFKDALENGMVGIALGIVPSIISNSTRKVWNKMSEIKYNTKAKQKEKIVASNIESQDSLNTINNEVNKAKQDSVKFEDPTNETSIIEAVAKKHNWFDDDEMSLEELANNVKTQINEHINEKKPIYQSEKDREEGVAQNDYTTIPSNELHLEQSYFNQSLNLDDLNLDEIDDKDLKDSDILKEKGQENYALAKKIDGKYQPLIKGTDLTNYKFWQEFPYSKYDVLSQRYGKIIDNGNDPMQGALYNDYLVRLAKNFRDVNNNEAIEELRKALLPKNRPVLDWDKINDRLDKLNKKYYKQGITKSRINDLKSDLSLDFVKYNLNKIPLSQKIDLKYKNYNLYEHVAPHFARDFQLQYAKDVKAVDNFNSSQQKGNVKPTLLEPTVSRAKASSQLKELGGFFDDIFKEEEQEPIKKNLNEKLDKMKNCLDSSEIGED